MHPSSDTNADAGAQSLLMATLQNDFIGGAVERASRFRQVSGVVGFGVPS